jgi:NADH-ubiquinone oxidoreductase chain 5
MHWYGASSFSGSVWFMPFYSTYGFSFDPLGIGYMAVSVFDSGWVEYFGGQVL